MLFSIRYTFSQYSQIFSFFVSILYSLLTLLFMHYILCRAIAFLITLMILSYIHTLVITVALLSLGGVLDDLIASHGLALL